MTLETTKKNRVIFMGTADFALDSLRALAKDPTLDLALVISQPDRPRGRGQKRVYSPLKKAALDLDLAVFQPEDVNEEAAINKIKALEPDYLVVVAYGQILSQALLSIPTKACLNIHASLLPSYRGAAPIHYALMAGEKETGVCSMHMSAELDAGDLIYCERVPLLEADTTGSLHDRLAALTGPLIRKTLRDLEAGTAPRTAQTGPVSYAPQIYKKDRFLDFSLGGRALVDKVRGLYPYPGALLRLEDKTYGLSQVAFTEGPSPARPGTVVKASAKEGLIIATKDGQLEIVRLKAAGKKEMTAKAYLNGQAISIGSQCKGEK